MLNVASLGPREAVKKLSTELEGATEEARALWRRHGRIAAIMASCPKSFGSVVSAVNNWIDFIQATHGKDKADRVAFPPDLTDVVLWSHAFRCFGTYINYVGNLRKVCHAWGIEAPPSGHPALRAAAQGIAKKCAFLSKQKMFIQRLAALCA